MINIQFRLGYWDRVSAIRAINRLIPAMVWFRRVAWALLIAAAAALFISLDWALFLFFLPIIWFAVVSIIPLYTAWVSRTLPAFQHQDLTFTPEGIEIRGAGSGVVQWEAVIRFAETKKFLLLFYSSQVAWAIPKMHFPKDINHQLSDFIIGHICSADLIPATIPPESKSDSHMVAEYTTSIRECYQAIMAGSKHGPAMWPFYLLVLALISWTVIIPTWKQWHESGSANVSFTSALLGLMPLIVILCCRPLSSLWTAYRMIKTNRAAGGVLRIELSESGLRIMTGLSNNFFEWPSFLKIVEDGRFFLFYLSKIQFFFAPKRALDITAISIIRRILQDRVDQNRASLLSN
jgi:hypothetical protein